MGWEPAAEHWMTMKALHRTLSAVVVAAIIVCLPFLTYNFGADFLPEWLENFVASNDWLRWVAVVVVLLSAVFISVTKKQIQRDELG